MQNAEIEAGWKKVQEKAGELASAIGELAGRPEAMNANIQSQMYEANRRLEEVLFRASNVASAQAARSEEAVEEAAEQAIEKGKVIAFPGNKAAE